MLSISDVPLRPLILLDRAGTYQTFKVEVTA